MFRGVWTTRSGCAPIRPIRPGRSTGERAGSGGLVRRWRPAPRPQILGRDLAERALDAEVGEVQVLLVDDRRDPRVDLDHVLADELDVEEVLDLELGDDPFRQLHQGRVLERLEVHREAGAHRLAGLRVAEQDASPVGDAVDRPLLAGRELHHEQLGLVVRRAARRAPRAAAPPRRRAGSSAAARAGRPTPRARGSRASRTRRSASARRRGRGSRARARRLRPPRRRARAARPALARRSGRAARRSRPCRSSGGSSPATRRARRRRRSARGQRPVRAGRRTTAAARRRRPRARQTSRTASAKPGSEPAGTRWNASQRWRPTARSDMSVPTSRTSRSPFSRSPRSSAAVPGAPQAETTTVIGFTTGRFCPLRAARGAGPARRPASPASSRASSRPGRPRSPGA